MKNTTIFKRLLGYLKAYRLRLFFVLLSAVISTAFRRTLFHRREETVRSRKERRYRSRWIYASSRRRRTSV